MYVIIQHVQWVHLCESVQTCFFFFFFFLVDFSEVADFKDVPVYKFCNKLKHSQPIPSHTK